MILDVILAEAARDHVLLNFMQDIINTNDNIKIWLINKIYNPIDVSAYFGIHATKNGKLYNILNQSILKSVEKYYRRFKHIYKFETGKTYDLSNKKLLNVSEVNEIDLYLKFCEKIKVNNSYVFFSIVYTWYKYDPNFRNFPVQLLKYIDYPTIDFFLSCKVDHKDIYKYDKLFNFLVKYRPEFAKDKRILTVIL